MITIETFEQAVTKVKSTDSFTCEAGNLIRQKKSYFRKLISTIRQGLKICK